MQLLKEKNELLKKEKEKRKGRKRKWKWKNLKTKALWKSKGKEKIQKKNVI